MALQPVPTDRAEWLAMRRRFIGGSEIATLFGVQPDYALAPFALWQIKAGHAPEPDVGGERIEWGVRLESVIAEGAAEQEGWTIRKGRYAVCDDCDGMGATLDFEIDGTDERGPGVLEVKNADWLIHKRTWTDGEPPLHILLQLQHQLACSGYSWGAVACLVGGNDLRVYRYEAKPKLIADIKRRVRAFWQSVADNKPPPVSGSDSDATVLRAIYAETTDELADMTDDNELPEICARMTHAAARRKEAEAEEAKAKNELRAKVGPHTRIETQGFRISVSVTPAKAEREPPEGYMIPGRAEVRRYTVKEIG